MTRAVDRGCRRAEHHRRTGQPGQLDGCVTCLDPRRPIALVRRLVLLVDDHEADLGERREDGQPRPDDDRHRSSPDPPPLVGSLSFAEARMDERDVDVEVGSQPVDERRRKRDFRDEHKHRPAGLERRRDGLDVDGGLASPRDALEEQRSRVAGDRRGPNRDHGSGLLVAQRRVQGPGAAPPGGSRGQRPPWSLADLGHGESSAGQPGDRSAAVASGQVRAGQTARRGGGQFGQGVPLARAERTSLDGGRVRCRSAPRVGRQDPAFEARPRPGRRERPVDRHQPVRLEHAEPTQQARTALRRGDIPGGPRARGELLEQVERDDVHADNAAVGGGCRRPLDDQLEPFEHPWREHRPKDQGRRDEVVAGDPARERKGQGWQQRPVGAHPRCQRLRLDALGFGRVAQHDGERLAATELDDHGLAGFDVRELVRHRVRVRAHATGPRRVDRHLDEATGPDRDRFRGVGFETKFELHA